jgi:hypothetical protein
MMFVGRHRDRRWRRRADRRRVDPHRRKGDDNNGRTDEQPGGQVRRELLVERSPGGTVEAPWKSHHAGGPDLLRELLRTVPRRDAQGGDLRAHHNEGSIVVIGVDATTRAGAAQSFVKKSGVTFPIAFDPNGVVTTGIFKFAAVPETAFVTAGRRQQIYFGAIPKSTSGRAGSRRCEGLVESEGARRDERCRERPEGEDEPVGARRARGPGRARGAALRPSRPAAAPRRRGRWRPAATSGAPRCPRAAARRGRARCWRRG